MMAGKQTPLPICSRFETSLVNRRTAQPWGPFFGSTPKLAVDLPQDLPEMLRGLELKSRNMDRGPCARLLNRYGLSAGASLPHHCFLKSPLSIHRKKKFMSRSSPKLHWVTKLPLADTYPQTSRIKVYTTSL